MDVCERRYRQVIGSIGIGLLAFLLLTFLFGLLTGGVALLLPLLGATGVFGEILYDLMYGAGYLLCFMLPVFVIKRVFAARKLTYLPMASEARLSPWLPLILFAGISMVLVQAYLNSALADLVGYSFVGVAEPVPLNTPYRVVLQFITTCLVPGFCEEFLFRGAIQSNCAPFGRTNAILISSLTFALMHQNVAQFLYTFAAGILLGLVYEYTGSIWNCVVLHTVNNFVSLFGTVLLSTLSERAGVLAVMLLEGGIFLLGVISMGILLPRFFGKREPSEHGFFGRSLPASDTYAVCPVSPRRVWRLAATPSMIIYVVFCTAEMLALFLLVRGGYGLV